ncbi:MAG: rhomboid family intramembrane serine protease [Actinomycetota bacterium]
MAAQPETCYLHPGRETRVHCTRCDRPICPDCMTAAPVGHHCPACVAEARRETRRVRLLPRRPRSVTAVLLVINLSVFVVEMGLGGATDTRVLARMGAMVPILVAQGEYWRLFTAIFLHVGVVHLALNSLGLYIFGNLIENVLGSARFLAIYLVGGLCASATSFAFSGPGTVAAGASGAIFALLGAWLAYNLRRRSLSLARSNIQGALVLIAINLVFGFSVPGIDNLAHLGGLAAGVGAGLAAEGIGRRDLRAVTRIAGFVLLLAVAAALTAWRVTDLQGLLGSVGPLP